MLLKVFWFLLVTFSGTLMQSRPEWWWAVAIAWVFAAGLYFYRNSRWFYQRFRSNTRYFFFPIKRRSWARSGLLLLSVCLILMVAIQQGWLPNGPFVQWILLMLLPMGLSHLALHAWGGPTWDLRIKGYRVMVNHLGFHQGSFDELQKAEVTESELRLEGIDKTLTESVRMADPEQLAQLQKQLSDLVAVHQEDAERRKQLLRDFPKKLRTTTTTELDRID